MRVWHRGCQINPPDRTAFVWDELEENVHMYFYAFWSHEDDGLSKTNIVHVYNTRRLIMCVFMFSQAWQVLFGWGFFFFFYKTSLNKY